MQHLRKLPIAVLFLLFLIGVATAGYLMITLNPYSKTKLDHGCLVANNALPDCYSRYYTDYAETAGVQVAIDTLRTRSKTDPVLYASCHNTMHTLGRVAYRAYGSLPVSFQYADYFCWSGYYHGVVEGALRGVREESVSRETLRDLCSPTTAMEPRSSDQFNCIHGIGHALMYMTGNNLPQSLKRCEDLGDDWSVQHCATGVFMENTLADGADHKSAYLPTEDMHYPCTIVDVRFKEACYLVQSGLIIKKFAGDFAQSFAFCDAIPEPGLRTQCARGLGKEAAQRGFYDKVTAARTCERAPSELIADCFFGVISDLEGQYHDDDISKTFCEAVSAPLRTQCLSVTLGAVKESTIP